MCTLPFIPTLHIYVSSSLSSSSLTADPTASLKRRSRGYLDIWREENGCTCPELSRAAEYPCWGPQGRARFQRSLTQSQLPAWTTQSSSIRFNGAEVGSEARGMLEKLGRRAVERFYKRPQDTCACMRPDPSGQESSKVGMRKHYKEELIIRKKEKTEKRRKK